MKSLLLILFFILIVSAQVAFWPHFSIAAVAPNLILAISLVWAIYLPDGRASWLILIPGFLLDLLVGRPFGLITLSLWLAFCFVRWLGRSFFKRGGAISLLVLSALGVLSYELILAALNKLAEPFNLAGSGFYFSGFYFYPFLPLSFIINLVLCLAVYWVFKKIHSYFTRNFSLNKF